jgi:predicted metalloprotease with PDZ domain
MGGLTGGGWSLTYNDHLNEIMSAAQAAHGEGDYTSSIGLTVKSDGTVADVIPGMAAFETGMSPYTRIVTVNGEQFTLDGLTRAIVDSTAQESRLVLQVMNSGYLERHEVTYHGGPRYPHLVRNASETNYLDQILQPRAAK